jgi:hypothetical protein
MEFLKAPLAGNPTANPGTLSSPLDSAKNVVCSCNNCQFRKGHHWI